MVRTEKMHRIKVNKSKKKMKVLFIGEKPVFLGLKIEFERLEQGGGTVYSTPKINLLSP